jgi:hypothetical protein
VDCGITYQDFQWDMEHYVLGAQVGFPYGSRVDSFIEALFP